MFPISIINIHWIGNLGWCENQQLTFLSIFTAPISFISNPVNIYLESEALSEKCTQIQPSILEHIFEQPMIRSNVIIETLVPHFLAL